MILRRGTLLTAIAVTTACAPTGIPAQAEPVVVTHPDDRLILEAFLGHCDRLPEHVTRDAVAQITQGELICWTWSKYVEMPLTAYRLTRDERHLDLFIQLMDVLLTRLRRGPDGYLGFRGVPLELFRDPKNPDAEGDVVITAFAVTRIMAEFAEIVRADPDLSDRIGRKADAYIAIATEHLVPKWDARERYVDLGSTGAIYRMGTEVGDHRKDLTHPHNKQSKACTGLIALYRVTGNDEYFRKAIKLGIRFKHTLKLEDGRYRWNYWDPAGDWDRKIDNPQEWKHWIGAEHRGGYHDLTMEFVTALYDCGVVFDRTDIDRFMKTQLDVCWNGSVDAPEFKRSDGSDPREQTFLAPALARFSEPMRRCLYSDAAAAERAERRNHGWQGGPSAQPYLENKYLQPATPAPRRLDLRAQFCRNPENVAFLKELEFSVTE